LLRDKVKAKGGKKTGKGGKKERQPFCVRRGDVSRKEEKQAQRRRKEEERTQNNDQPSPSRSAGRRTTIPGCEEGQKQRQGRDRERE